jgi:hypothetical protein
MHEMETGKLLLALIFALQALNLKAKKWVVTNLPP